MASFSNPVESSSVVIYEARGHSLDKIKVNLFSIQSLFLERSFRAQVADYGYFHRHWMGDIVALVGTSTAGKSSIIHALRKVEPDRVEDGGDLRSDAIFIEYLKKKYPDEIALLEKFMNPLDIPKAVWSSERSWKTACSDAEKIEAEKVIQRIKIDIDSAPDGEIDALFEHMDSQMFDEAFERSRRGERVIFDVLHVDAVAQHALMRNFDGPLRIVLVYCPFSLLSLRMGKRNQEAEESGQLANQRNGTFPLDQFSRLYTQKSESQKTWEEITRDQAIQAFDENFDKGVISARKMGCKLPAAEQIAADKRNFRQIFLKNLGFVDGIDKVEIAPRSESLYHHFINSGELTAEESAKILHEG